MAPLTDDEQLLHQCFRKLKELQIEIQQLELRSCTLYRVINGDVQ